MYLSRILLSVSLSIFSTCYLVSCSSKSAETNEQNFSQKIAPLLQAKFTEQTGIAVKNVVCPENIELKSNNNFECEITDTEGNKLKAQITQKDDRGNINWDVKKGLIDLSGLEENIYQGIKEKLKAETKVSCGGSKYRIANAGQTFNCQAQDSQGKQAIIEVNIQEQQGNFNVDWKLK